MEIKMTRPKPGAPRGALKRYEALYAAINSLPERDRVLIHQIYWDDTSLREIARTSGIDVAAISRRHQRILRDLRTALEGTGLEQGRYYDADGTACYKCAGCNKWNELPRRCSCGHNLNPQTKSFDFGYHTTHDINTSPRNADSNEMSDAELLARAQADADAWQRRLQGRD